MDLEEPAQLVMEEEMKLCELRTEQTSK